MLCYAVLCDAMLCYGMVWCGMVSYAMLWLGLKKLMLVIGGTPTLFWIQGRKQAGGRVRVMVIVRVI